MIHIDLTQEEKRILMETLESYLADLRYEIGNTDRMNYRDQLKAQKAVLMKVLETLKNANDDGG